MKRWVFLLAGIAVAAALLALLLARRAAPPPQEEIDAASRAELERLLEKAEREPASP